MHMCKMHALQPAQVMSKLVGKFPHQLAYAALLMWPSAWPRLGLNRILGPGRAIDWARHGAKANLTHIWPISGDRPA